MHREEQLLIHFQKTGDLIGSTTERITVALALGRSDLLPEAFRNDSLSAYVEWLDGRQQRIVARYRFWKLEYVIPAVHWNGGN